MSTDDGPIPPMTDGVVHLRQLQPGDAALLIAGRDEAFHRWLGPGSDEPQPRACVVVGDEMVGWVDYDDERDWLHAGEVNVGYNVFAGHRNKGYATRAVQLLMHHLALRTDRCTATLLIDANNERSLALATRLRFQTQRRDHQQCYFKRRVPPLSYSDGVVTIRRPRIEDLDADLEAKDDQQIDWLWLPGQRESWEAMTPREQRNQSRRGLEEREAAFGTGPKWTFSVDVRDAACVGYVDCDLANDCVPAGEANISYSSHPRHRGLGYTQRAVRLIMRFLRDHTGAREAHIIVDAANSASLRVARALDATPTKQWTNVRARTMIRHVAPLDSIA